MAAPSLFLHQPTCSFGSNRFSAFPDNNSHRRSALSLRLRSSSSIFRRGHLRNRSIRAVSGPKTMDDSVKTYAWRDDGSVDGEERVRVFEHEAFINGSSELRNELVGGGGIDATINRLSKWVVSAVFCSVLLLRHDGTALWAVIGSISNSALSVALKRIINQERPVATLRSDPGMPSSHAQSISFISLFAIMSVLEWLGTNSVSMFLSAIILASGSYFTWLRVSQKLHTVSQVVVGAILGSVFSILWYMAWNSVVLGAFVGSSSVQVAIFLVAAAFSLGFVVYVVLNWFRYDR
ncbi:PREDICTED: lipid phosphate phosphatase epsilon 2, chloroplastic-like [Tarenaya hassleriana]|uniref:lipid phosphate phosphatase epsilon 2, chloroplastic-like n=1 Tax=Tarenaya hassleriana TaxID=28532 RepID=UPI00053C5A30|nr:PREDICTED: lipid phosphate phosphatase epsilon 2, chloroplastic-like [Tarenaya hassleriana]